MKFEHINTVIFDLDGTLLDTLTDLMNAVNHALAVSGFPIRTRDEVRRFVGNGLPTLVKRSLPESAGPAASETVLADTRAYYTMHCTENTAPYPGVIDMLRNLSEKGLRLGVVSNKPDEQVQSLCRSEFGDLISFAAGASNGFLFKPAPDSLFRCMEVLGGTQNSSVYIGDSDVDIQTAKNAQIPCISVLWGFRDKEFLESSGAGLFAQSPSDICRFF